jgi:hypothetical protein
MKEIKEKRRTAFDASDVCIACGNYYRKQYAWENKCPKCRGEK